jgi:hypothetical protein
VAAFGGLKKFKMVAVAMVTKVQKMLPIIFLIPPISFLWQLRQSLSNRLRFFLAYLVPLDVDVVPNKFHQFLFGE